MPCRHCSHCAADPVLRLPESHRPADPAYDTALLAAYTAAAERSSQPVRLLLSVNPWLTRSRLHDQLRRARSRGATPPNTAATVAAPDVDEVQRLLDSQLWTRLRRFTLVPEPAAVVEHGLAPDESSAARLIAAARVHASA